MGPPIRPVVDRDGGKAHAHSPPLVGSRLQSRWLSPWASLPHWLENDFGQIIGAQLTRIRKRPELLMPDGQDGHPQSIEC